MVSYMGLFGHMCFFDRDNPDDDSYGNAVAELFGEPEELNVSTIPWRKRQTNDDDEKKEEEEEEEKGEDNE